MPLTNLGWKSGEGYDAVQDTVTGQRYYRTPGGQYLDPQSGAQVQPPGAASTPVGYTPAPQPTQQPTPQPQAPPQGGPMRFDGGEPQYAQNPNDPNRMDMTGWGQPESSGYPQMPGYPGQQGGGSYWDQGGGGPGYDPDASYIAWIQARQGPGLHTEEMRTPPPGFQQRHPEYANPGGGINFQGGQQGGGQQQGGGGLTSLGWKSQEGYDAVQGADGKRYYRTPSGQFLDPQTGAQVTPSGMSPQYAGGMTGGATPPGGPMRFDDPNGGMTNRGWPGAYAGGQARGPTATGQPAQTYTGQQPNAGQQSSTMPNVPLPYQVNPAVWDSLSRTGRGLALGAAGAGGWDPQDYEDQINATRPQGYARQASSYRYQTPRAGNESGF